MVYKHKRTGERYRVLFTVFDTQRQAPGVVYISLKTGVLFSRDGADFSDKFEFVEYSQSQITPRTPNEEGKG